MMKNKSVIVIDTPDKCRTCCLNYDSYGLCNVCSLADKITDEYYENNTKPDWCPLQPLPECKDLTTYTSGESTLDKRLGYAHDQGYNDCLYKIMYNDNEVGCSAYKDGYCEDGKSCDGCYENCMRLNLL